MKITNDPMNGFVFPCDAGQDFDSVSDKFIQRGFQPGITLRQYAAINLKVPNSGIPELDDMIRESLRDQLSGQALGWCNGYTAKKYNEILYAVARKFPGESRHETALRYIRQAEEVHGGPCVQDTEAGRDSSAPGGKDDRTI